MNKHIEKLEYFYSSIFSKKKYYSKLKKENEKLNIFEIEQKKIDLKSTPRTIVIDPTNDCNSRCIICYKSYSQIEKVDLSLSNLNKIKPFLKNAIDVDLTGTGDLFLNKNFRDLIKACKEYKVFIALTSNGMLIGDNLETISQIIDLTISFDGGTKQTFEKIRRGTNFEKILRNIKLVNSLKHKPYMRFNVVVSKLNLNELPDIISIAKELDIPEVCFRPLSPADTSLQRIILTKEDDLIIFNQIKEKVINLSHHLGIKVSFMISLGYEKSYSDVDKLIGENRNKFVYCTMPWRFMYIESNGKVRPCCCFIKDLQYIGDLNKNTIEEIWNGESYRHLRASMVGLEKLKLNEYCKNCRDSNRFM